MLSLYNASHFISQIFVEQWTYSKLLEIHSLSLFEHISSHILTSTLYFFNKVVALCTYPKLLESNEFPSDAKDRAKRILAGCKGGSIGNLTFKVVANAGGREYY